MFPYDLQEFIALVFLPVVVISVAAATATISIVIVAAVVISLYEPKR